MSSSGLFSNTMSILATNSAKHHGFQCFGCCAYLLIFPATFPSSDTGCKSFSNFLSFAVNTHSSGRHVLMHYFFVKDYVIGNCKIS